MARENIQGFLHFHICLVILLQFLSNLCPATAMVANVSACDPRGTWAINPNECVCKANVQGTLCDQCKPGYFHLSQGNIYGCLQCACGSLAAECTAIKFMYSSMSLLKYDGQVTDINAMPLAVPITRIASSVIQFASFAGVPSFWRAFHSGDCLNSYGGNLVVHLNIFTSIPIDQGIAGPKIILMSNDGTRIANSYELLLEDNIGFSVRLEESQWHYVPKNVSDITQRYERRAVSRFDMLNVLTALHSILVRASPIYQHQTGIKLEKVSWPVGVVSDHGKESSLEQCKCIEGYIGFRCEFCAPGYARVYDSTYTNAATFAECKKAYSDSY